MDRTATLLLCAVTAQGIPILGAHGRCHCTGTSAKVVPPKSIRSLKFNPRGSHCEKAEIIVTVKNEMKVCVDPEAKWLEALKERLNKNILVFNGKTNYQLVRVVPFPRTV